MRTLEIFLRLAGALQLAILVASASVPRVFDWRRNLAPLHPFLRRLFFVYGAFIVLVIVGFGTLTLRHAGAIASGEPLARAISGFIAIFWFARLIVQLLVFDCRQFLTNWFLRAGYHGLTLAFIYLTAVYAWAAIFPL